MTESGYLKITDFGFAKAVGRHGITRSFCGTPDYLAPEVVLQQVGDRSRDLLNRLKCCSS
jgi:serine/threonine protein kinase